MKWISCFVCSLLLVTKCCGTLGSEFDSLPNDTNMLSFLELNTSDNNDPNLVEVVANLLAHFQGQSSDDQILTATGTRANPPMQASNPSSPASPLLPSFMSVFVPTLMNVAFGPTATGRSRGLVHTMYGYMPYGDGYGAGVLNSDGAKPWYWNYDGTGPQFSSNSIGPADFLPSHGPVCPPDCTAPTVDLLHPDPAPA
eukprot:c10077_g1_i1.p1 GENE.c10077_g1_i1~~c10077_g1_i1.p1  ORF type:complete len:198 (+),score=43.03 c10077_g1_i1:76-669(+)